MLKKLIIMLFVLWSAALFAKPIRIVAAENFYGSVAEELGGPYVTVMNVLNNPNQDPHAFSSNPSTAREVATADLVIYSGIDYDPWMKNLLAPTSKQPKKVLVVASLVGKKDGDNPHIWYDPPTMHAYAQALTAALVAVDPAHAAYFRQQYATFQRRYAVLMNKIVALRHEFRNAPVIATEPVFNEMGKWLHLTMYGIGFQNSVMNDAEPSVSDVRDFETKLKQRQVRVLIFNKQVSSPLVDRMKQLATAAGVPMVGVTETQPPQVDYFNWMSNQLDELALVLKNK